MSKKTDQMYLVQYSGDWADEMAITGGRVMSKKEKEHYFDCLQEIFNVDGSYTHQFGSNQDIFYEAWNDLKDCFTSKKISLEDAKVLESLGLGEYGNFPS